MGRQSQNNWVKVINEWLKLQISANPSFSSINTKLMESTEKRRPSQNIDNSRIITSWKKFKFLLSHYVLLPNMKSHESILCIKGVWWMGEFSHTLTNNDLWVQMKSFWNNILHEYMVNTQWKKQTLRKWL